MRSIHDIPTLENVPVLVRAALNAPVENGAVVNDYRLQKAIPTLSFLAAHHARVVVISHIGEKGTETLEPVAEALKGLISNVSFFGETIGERARQAVRELAPGKILVLENLRRDKREVANDPSFAQELAQLADVFVEDSFDTCHRMHASIVGVPKLLPSYAGLQLEEEVRQLGSALVPTSPSLAVIGGAKFSTKEAVLKTLLVHYDHVFVGGALANDFLKVSGKEVGKSLVSGADESEVKTLLSNEKLALPVDSIVIPQEDMGALNMRSAGVVKDNDAIGANDVILDHGPKTDAILADFTRKAKTVLWNGPLGNYEHGFIDATDSFARAIASSSARSIVGGGDTVASIENLGLSSRFSFVSTGGGAMLDYLATGTLPGIEVLG